MAIGDRYWGPDGNLYAITEQHSGFIWFRDNSGDLTKINKEELSNYRTYSGGRSIHLQGWGLHPAKRADEIIIGEDFFVWNQGSISKPLRIIKTTPTQIVFQTMTKDGQVWERRLKKDRLVAFTTRGGF